MDLPRTRPAWAFGLLLASAAGLAEGGSCGPDGSQARVSVRHVIDGDTVVLRDGQTLRLVGLDTPEIGYGGRRSEALAGEAQAALRGLVLSHGGLGLVRGRQSHDRYGRALGHLFLEDGANVQAWLLEHGLGTHLFLPPESNYTECYAQAEARARAKRRGLWRLREFQPVAVQHLSGTDPGYRVVRGRVGKLRWTRSSLWINLEGGVGLQILKRDLGYFHSMSRDSLSGQTVLARGWLVGRAGRYRMRLRHPSFLEITQKGTWR